MAACVVTLATALQLFDLSAFIPFERSQTASALDSTPFAVTRDPRWDALIAEARVVDYQGPELSIDPGVFYEVALRAISAGKPVTTMRVSRDDRRQKAWQAADAADFQAGRLHSDWLYVLQKDSQLPAGVTGYMLDGITIIPPESVEFSSKVGH